jgi:hypothetical protein
MRMNTTRWHKTVPLLLLPVLLLVVFIPSPSILQFWFVTAYTIIQHNHRLVQNYRYQSLQSPLRRSLLHPRYAHLSSGTLLYHHTPDDNDIPIYDGPENTNDDNDEDDDVCVGGGNSDEEECEIDWSKMPGFDNDTNDNDSENVLSLRAQLERQFQMPSSTASAAMAQNSDLKEDDDPPLVETSSHLLKPEDITIASQSSSSTMMSDFQRLEMIWQQREESTECDIYEPITCGGQTCTTCAGTGHTTCRFCRGTKFLYLPITHDVLLSPDHQNNRNDDFEITQRPPQQPPSKNSSYVSCSICHTTGTEICRTCQGSGWIAHWTQLGVRVGDILK